MSTIQNNAWLSASRRLAALSALLLTIAAQVLVGQTSTSIISGTVTDTSGAIVAGAQVQVKNVGTGIVVSLTTDPQGRFRASEMLIGDYEVQVAQAGFQTVVRKGIATAVGGEAIVDIALPVGQAQQVVTVDAQVSQVDTTTSAITNTVTNTQIEELPMGARNQTDLLLLAPGVASVEAVGGSNYGRQQNYSISGSRANGIQFLIDNTNLATYNGHSTGSATTGQTLGLEAIGDYQTLTNTYSAQFGGNGGVVNAASKSGTNSLHGSLYGYLTNSSLLSARDTFDSFVRAGDTIAKAPPTHKGIFGASIGGPIRKNKAFLFANYEGVRLGGENTSILNNVPDINAHNGYLPCSAAAKFSCNPSTNLAFVGLPASIAPLMALFPVGATSSTSGVGNYISIVPQRSQDDYLLTRFDYALSPKDTLFVRLVRDTASSDTLTPNGSSVPLITGQHDTTQNYFVTMEEDHTLSPTLINLARVSFLRPFEQAATSSAPIPAMEAINIAGASQGTLALGGKLTIGPTPRVPYRTAEETYQAMDDVIWNHGTHSLRFGLMFAKVADFTNQNNTGTQWTFGNILGFLTASPTQLIASLPGHLDNYRDALSSQFMPYVNDEWKITRRLTLNLGVRYEWVSNPGERHGRLSNVTNLATNTNWVTVPTVMPNNPSTKNFAPRVGFAYDPFPDHKTSIRAGFGMFYNELTAHVWLNPYWISAPFLSTTIVNPSWPVPVIGGAATPATDQFGLNYMSQMHTPYMMQYNLSIQREIAQGTIVSLAYVGSGGVHLLSAVDANFPVAINGLYGTPGAAGTVTPNPRLNPNFSALTLRSTNSNSNYNSLQAGVNRRFANHFQAQVSYTFSKSMDVVSGDSGPDSSGPTGGSQLPQNPFNASLEHARSNFDRTNVFKINGIYELPFGRNELVKGWRLSGVITAQSGHPFTITDGFDQTGSGQTGKGAPSRPNLIPGGNQNPILGDPNNYFDVNQFSLNPVGTFGNLGRNTLIGPGVDSVNLALLKRTAIRRISEQFNLEFRAEASNAFNHPNYQIPNQLLWNNGTTRNPTAAQITATGVSARQIQLALKATF